ncbi:MAG TPA: flagellar filament capping protein FliD, partial [Gemmataceae bacterium]|nr:flagellar filament capping protein FliD [Gemmataceae bacterium]
GQGGPLLGNQSAVSIQETIRRAATDVVAGIAQQVNHLSAIGITTNEQGHLDLDESRLDAALSGQVSGVTLAGIRSLFALGGSSTNPGVQFVTGSDKTKAPASPVQVDVTQAATQGSMTATNALAASTVIDSTNNTFTITLDGVASGTLTLAAGTYTPDQLAQQVQGLVNNDAALAGRQVAVSLSGGKLVFTSASYGSASRVAIGTGSALSALGFTGTEGGTGQDVAGNFVVNGVVEQATGNGQLLTGAAGNANTDGLVVRAALTPAQVVAGPEASITVSRGLASRTAQVLDSLLDPLTGRLKTIDDSFQSSIDDLNQQIQEQTDLMNAQHDALVAQFTALEETVSQLQATSNFLNGQLASLSSLGIGNTKK